MGERFYSIYHTDEAAVFMNYNVGAPQAQHQQQQPLQQQQLIAMGQQQQQHNVCSVGATGAGDISSYLSNSGYFSTAAATAAAIDLNNSRTSLRYCGNNNSNAYNYNKMLQQSNMLAKYGANVDSNYMPTATGNMMQHLVTYNGNNNNNGSITCGSVGYNRNRYMPYSRPVCVASAVAAVSGGAGAATAAAATTGSQHANNSLTMPSSNMPMSAVSTTAAAAAVASVGGGTASATGLNSYATYQHFTPIYQHVATVATAAPPPLPSSSQTSTAAVAATAGTIAVATVTDASSSAGSSYDRAVTAASNSADITYTHAPLTSILGSSSSIAASSNAAAGTGANVKKISLIAGGASVTTTTTTAMGAGGPSSIVATTSMPYSAVAQSFAPVLAADPSQTVTLQITNLDYSMDETSLCNFLLNQLKPITPVVSLVFEGSSYAKVTVPDLFFAKQVVSNLHRKKIGHKRMLVSYTRDSSLTEINTLRCQVAGLLKDVPYYTLPMYKFRELFQSRFKTSISVLDLYKMQDICIINSDNNEEKFISLQSELVNSLESSPLMEGLQHSVPYCTIHFKREQHKGWAEQEIEPLPNVFMTISEIQQIIYPLLKGHPGDIPVASLVHCIEGELNMQITANESGVNLEHLVCCVQGIQIQVNNFGIKILGWLELNKELNSGAPVTAGAITANSSSSERGGLYSKSSISDPLYQISREVIELVKMSPKSTIKFNRFIPAYHNHFGKQCRVADYGYTKLIELFEALSTVVQILGDGENRQITLTHRTQIRRFTSDLLRVLRAHGNKSVLLSQLPTIFAQTQNRNFDVTDYGVCDIADILDGLVNSNIAVVATVENGKDILISIPKRKQTISEIEKTSIFAGEMVELFRNAPQYTILFQKFVRSYHYHFAYQCRLSDYGFLKLADLMEAIQGVVEMELTSDEDKKIFLSPKVARRVFAEQCEELIRSMTGSAKTSMKLDEVLKLHKKKFGYQIQPQTLGVSEILKAIELLPYVEMFEKEDCTWIICHNEDAIFRSQCYRASKHILAYLTDTPTDNNNNKVATATENTTSSAAEPKKSLKLSEFISEFNEKHKENITENTVKAMKHAIEITTIEGTQYVQITNFMNFLMDIVRLLEQRPNVLLHDIKTTLHCSITSTFEFGFPNLFSIITAYPDIFAINLGVSQERTEIALLPNCELRFAAVASAGNRPHLFGSLKLPYSKQKPSRPLRAPLSEHNSRSSNLQGPPAKTRAMSNDSATCNIAATTASNSTYKTGNNNYQQHNNTTTKSLYTSKQQSSSTGFFAPPLGPYHMNNTSGGSGSIYSTATHQTSSMLNTSASNSCNSINSSNNSNSNKENSNTNNSFNNSFNIFNASFDSSTNNSTISDLNSSGSGGGGGCASGMRYMGFAPPPPPQIYGNYAAASKLWDRRHSSTFYQQPVQSAATAAAVLGSNSANGAGNGLPPLIMPSTCSVVSSGTQQKQHQLPMPLTAPPEQQTAGLYELVSNIQMYPMYEPPKPDTPPADNMPFWIDPIWANNSSITEHSKNNLLNIKLPELKSFNVLPMLLSPYTLSKTQNMKQPVFNFENHDRKIA